jgi:UDP-N-acetylglucosamine 2-epimerase
VIKVIEALPFFDTMAAEQAAKLILTDSRGAQKEAFFY